uniref:Uncharacterized protein n=1 Tax=Anguilla anguilla TaxID=7936 RepID=A0A0E9RJY8_ANGAN
MATGFDIQCKLYTLFVGVIVIIAFINNVPFLLLQVLTYFLLHKGNWQDN